MTLMKTSTERFATKFWPYKSPALSGHLMSLKMAGLGFTPDMNIYGKVLRRETNLLYKDLFLV